MSTFGKELKMYARTGLRSAPDWITQGRQVIEGSQPRARADVRGGLVDLFVKDQTEPRTREPAKLLSL